MLRQLYCNQQKRIAFISLCGRGRSAGMCSTDCSLRVSSNHMRHWGEIVESSFVAEEICLQRKSAKKTILLCRGGCFCQHPLPFEGAMAL